MYAVHHVKVHIFWDTKNVYNSERTWIQMRSVFINTNLICTHVLSLLETFWYPKNVHFHLMYLIHGSIISLMMTH